MVAKKIAILMSIDYDGKSESQCAHDVEQMATLLRTKYHFTDIYKTSETLTAPVRVPTGCLCSGDAAAVVEPACGCRTSVIPATREEIQCAFSIATNNDTVVFFYSGHGYRSDFVAAADSTQRFTTPQYHLLDANGAPMSREFLLGLAEDCAAAKQYFILDACYAAKLMPMPYELDGQHGQVHTCPENMHLLPQTLARKQIIVISASAGTTRMDDDGSELTKSFTNLLTANPHAQMSDLVSLTRPGIERVIGSNMQFSATSKIVHFADNVVRAIHTVADDKVLFKRRPYEENEHYVLSKRKILHSRNDRIQRLRTILGRSNMSLPLVHIENLVNKYYCTLFDADVLLLESTFASELERARRGVLHEDPESTTEPPHGADPVIVTQAGEHVNA